MMAVLKIKDLFLRAYLGFSDHEIGKLQDVVINITVGFDSSKSELSDNPIDTLNYKTLTKQIVELTENSHFNLIESLARKVLDIVMAHPEAIEATVEVDKPHALRFAESVSITLSAKRDDK